MSIKNYLTKILVNFFSKLNRSEGKDILDIFEKLILFSKGKHRGFYDINFEILQITKLAKLIDVKNIIDIGAHKGVYSELLLKHYPNAEYYLFEPQTNLYENLIKKFNNKNFHIFNFGLSNESRKLDFFQTKKDDGLGSIYNRQTEYIDDAKKEFSLYSKVEVKRFEDLNLTFNADIVKIDVEGNEMNVLKGFGDKISNVKIIQFEFGRNQLDSKFNFHDFYKFLSKNSFQIYRIHPSGIKRIIKYSWFEEMFIASNLLCINKKFIK
tara:strand:- start:294 stop:1094 length:801 start_codon:yes stop_codon:yes gene_type:complete